MLIHKQMLMYACVQDAVLHSLGLRTGNVRLANLL